MTAGPISGVIGGPLSGALLAINHHHGLSGWQWLFLLEGLPAILLGALVVFYLPESLETAHWLTVEQRAWLADTLQRQQGAPGDSSLRFHALMNGKAWLLALSYFLLNTCGYGVILWLPKLIHSLSGLGSFAIGMISAIPYLAAAVAMVLVGIHSDRTGERRWHAASFAYLAAVALPTAAYSRNTGVMVAALSIAVLSLYCMGGPFWAVSTNLLNETVAATGIALINAFGNLGGFCGPYLVGLVRSTTGEFKDGLFLLAAAIALSGCSLLLASPSAQGRTTGRRERSSAI
jgi:ACS family tartrate transporter-like MFS transporter